MGRPAIATLDAASTVLTGSAVGLVLAYVVRFHGLALFSIQSRMGRIDPSLDEAARSLGADRSRLLADVHLPLLWPGIATAALLVFVEVMKELPPPPSCGRWEATRSRSRSGRRRRTPASNRGAAALLIVAVGLVPVVIAIRLSRGTAEGPTTRTR